MYQVGEHVVYRNIGICIIEAIGKLGFSMEKEDDYYTLCPVSAKDRSKFYVPVDVDTSMRNVISSQEAGQYLTELEKMQTKPFCAKKTAELAAHYDELIEKQDLTSYLIMFKELCQKEEKVTKSGKKLGQLELKYKHQIEKLLVDEFSYALKETPELMKERLYKVVCIDS